MMLAKVATEQGIELLLSLSLKTEANARLSSKRVGLCAPWPWVPCVPGLPRLAWLWPGPSGAPGLSPGRPPPPPACGCFGPGFFRGSSLGPLGFPACPCLAVVSAGPLLAVLRPPGWWSRVPGFPAWLGWPACSARAWVPPPGVGGPRPSLPSLPSPL